MTNTGKLLSSLSEGTKAHIIEILAQKGALAQEELYQHLQETCGLKVSKHAVYAQLLKLMQLNIVERKNNTYQLTQAWITEALGFFSTVHKQYRKDTFGAQHCIPGEVYAFDTLKEFDHFLSRFEAQIIEQLPEKEDCFFAWACQHSWWLIFYMEAQNKILRSYRKKGIHFYSLFEGDTVLDRWNAKSLQKLGMPAKTNIKLFSGDIGIYNNAVLSLIWPIELQQELHSLLENAKSLEDIDMNYALNDLSERKCTPPLQLFICQDKLLAEKMRGKIVAEFKK